MSKYFLIESPDGTERRYVLTLGGYEEWTLLADKLREPGYGETYDPGTKKWVKDEAKEARRAKVAKLRDPEYLLDEMEAMKTTMAALKSELEQLKKGPLNG